MVRSVRTRLAAETTQADMRCPAGVRSRTTIVHYLYDSSVITT